MQSALLGSMQAVQNDPLKPMADTITAFPKKTACGLERNSRKDEETLELFISAEDLTLPRTSETSDSGSNVILASESSDEVVCRICRDETVDEHLISPCMCTGSLGKYHRRCLEEWLSKSTRNYCEICHHIFQTKRVNRSVREWWRRRRHSRERRYLVGDCICFFLLMPLILASSYLCTEGAWYYLRLEIKWTAAGLIVLGSFLWLIFSAWLIMTVRFHLNTWYRWRDRNQIVQLVDTAGNSSSGSENFEEPRDPDFQETAV